MAKTLSLKSLQKEVSSLLKKQKAQAQAKQAKNKKQSPGKKKMMKGG